MKRGTRRYVAVLAAVAGLSLAISLPVFGQARIDTSGHVMDANTQIGAGGYNSAVPNSQEYGNKYGYGTQPFEAAIATNNVTGGAGFRGVERNGINLGVGYTDPFAFRGLLAGQGVDQFIASSTGVPTMANPMASSDRMAAQPQQFYGASNNNQPAGYQPLTNAPGYIPAQPMTESPSDTRLGAVDFTQGPMLPKPNELLLPGPVDPTANSNPNASSSSLFAASPLYGVRQWQFNAAQMATTPGGQPTNPGSSLFGGQSPLQQGSGVQQFAQFQTPSETRLMAMRQELDNTNNPNNQTTNQTGAVQTLQQQYAQGSSGASQLQPMRPGMQTNSDPSQPLQPLTANTSQLQSTNLAPQAGDVSTSQSNRRYLNDIPLPPPTQQSAQFAILHQMMQTYQNSHPETDQEANYKFNQLLKLHQRAAANAEAGSNVLGSPRTNEPGAPGIEPGAGNPEEGPTANGGPAAPEHEDNGNLVKPGFSTLPNLNGISKESEGSFSSAPPVPIDSFATGMKSKGLADLVANGELLVQQQQYDRAIASYNDAIQVAPNNPLILMARANAELGGGYYAQASADLHAAIGEDPAVLIARYDLQKHLGPQRLKALSEDLKLIAQDSKKDPTHAFLYTYVLYNSHHLGLAAEWLNTADERSGGKDPAITDMKKYWNFNSESPASPAPATRPSSAVPGK